MRSKQLSISIRLVILLLVLSASVVSCNYFFKSNDNRVMKEKAVRININKEEAKLLVKASKNNLEILQLCETIKHTATEDTVKQLAMELEEIHIEILDNYRDLAREKLISIPYNASVNYDYNNDMKVVETENRRFLKDRFKEILDKTNMQMKLMDTLSQRTDNSEYKVLAIKDNYLLKSNINKIENTFSHLNQSI